MKRIVFFSPFWLRTGAEILLADCMKSLDGAKYQYAIAGRGKGELFAEFSDSVPKFDFRTYNFEENPEASKYNILYIQLTRLKRKLAGAINKKNLLQQFLDLVKQSFPADFWYINTIIMPDILEYAETNNIPTIIHSHEMEHMLIYISKEQTERLISYPSFIINVSAKNQKIFETLGRKTGMTIINPFVDLSNINPDDESRKKIRDNLGIPEEAIVWAMSGALDTNKDPMTFLDIADRVIKEKPDTYFMWLGGYEVTGYSEYVKKKAIELGIENKIIWAGSLKENYYDYFNAADALMLTSQKDSFPLVMIEAAALGKPIVSFNSGGISEFINDKRIGTIIPERDNALFRNAMLGLMTQPMDIAKEISKKRAKDFDKSVKLPEWQNLMSEALK